MSTVERAVFKFCGELANATAGSGFVREMVVVEELGGFFGGDDEIEGDNWVLLQGAGW